MKTKFEQFKNRREKICVVGLGYVGLPLLVALQPYFSLVGFDINKKRIAELKRGRDKTGEVDGKLLAAKNILFTSDPKSIASAKFVIVAVPTPVKEGNIPDMSLVEKATVIVGKSLAKGSLVIYESTVYPGATEEVCLPLLEKYSGLKAGVDFKIGYSPERVNPGDKEHTIGQVTKVVSGMDSEALELISKIYGTVTKVFPAKSIKVAEAAKVIENTQRDLNIALMNELAKIFYRMGFSVYDVLEAAGTKWNFLKFSPGLVGGHCIGVDPYYLTYKSQALGYQPEVVLAGRRINDSMGAWLVQEILKSVAGSGKDISRLRVLIAGITFKENVPDIRNSKVYDIYRELKNYGLTADVYDPIADKVDTRHEYGIGLIDSPGRKVYDLVLVAVAHNEFKLQPASMWKKHLSRGGWLADIKKIYTAKDAKLAGFNYWTL